MNEIKIMRLAPEVQMPEFATTESDCFDVRAFGLPESLSLFGGESVTIGTGLVLELEPNQVALAFSRSGQGFNHNVRLSNCVGVIDSHYRGEIKVSLYNDSNRIYRIKNGDRIAQILVIERPLQKIVEVKSVSETDRGSNGFGSTGN